MKNLDKESQDRLQLINGRLARAVGQMAEVLERENVTFRVTQALRSWAEQDKLYAEGRSAPGKIVTLAPGGHSWHNFGMAVDLAPDDASKAGFQPDWNLSHPVWKRMVQVGEMLGLLSGSRFRTFPDNPHFQLTGRFPISPDDETRVIFKHVGMEGVWVEAGLHGN